MNKRGSSIILSALLMLSAGSEYALAADLVLQKNLECTLSYGKKDSSPFVKASKDSKGVSSKTSYKDVQEVTLRIPITKGVEEYNAYVDDGIEIKNVPSKDPADGEWDLKFFFSIDLSGTDGDRQYDIVFDLDGQSKESSYQDEIGELSFTDKDFKKNLFTKTVNLGPSGLKQPVKLSFSCQYIYLPE